MKNTSKICLIGFLLAGCFMALVLCRIYNNSDFSIGVMPRDGLMVAPSSGLYFTSANLRCTIFSGSKKTLSRFFDDPEFSCVYYSTKAKNEDLGGTVFPSDSNYAIASYQKPELPNEVLTRLAPKNRSYCFIARKISKGERTDQYVYFFESDNSPDFGDVVICW